MKRGDIYWLDLDPTLGHEQSGFRPVVIVSATAFNLASKLPVVVPITNGGAFAERLGFAVSLKDAGLKQQGLFDAINLAQSILHNAMENLSKPYPKAYLMKLWQGFQ